MNILGSEAICHFHTRAIARRRKSVVSFTHTQNIICSQTQLDDVAHEQNIIRPAFSIILMAIMRLCTFYCLT